MNTNHVFPCKRVLKREVTKMIEETNIYKNQSIKTLRASKLGELEQFYNSFKNSEIEIIRTQSHIVYNPILNCMDYVILVYYND